MKTKTITSILFIILFVFAGKSIAQNSIVTSGIFLTASDFKKNKLIQEADCENDKEKFKTNDFFSKSSFDVLYKGKKTTYQKKDIYAFRDCENNVWRFYNNKEYQIIETKALYLYTIKKIVVNGGVIEKDPIYYFSSDADGDIKELNIDNLKLTYPNNQTFRNMIDSEFQTDEAIYSYDHKHKMYLVNYLFIQSKK